MSYEVRLDYNNMKHKVELRSGTKLVQDFYFCGNVGWLAQQIYAWQLSLDSAPERYVVRHGFNHVEKSKLKGYLERIVDGSFEDVRFLEKW